MGDAVDTAVGLTLFVIRVTPTLLLWTLLLFLPVRLAIRWGRRRSGGRIDFFCHLTFEACKLVAATSALWSKGDGMPSRLRFLSTGALILTLLCGSSIAARQDVTLRYRWTKGDALRYRVTQQTTTTINGIPGMDNLTVEQSILQVVKTTAGEVAADGTATLSQSVESVQDEHDVADVQRRV